MASGASAGPTKRVLVPVANGSEEMEAVIVIDVLRRAGTAKVHDYKKQFCSQASGPENCCMCLWGFVTRAYTHAHTHLRTEDRGHHVHACAGADVVVASVEDSLQVKCARGTNVVADTLLKSVPADEVFDLIALPVCEHSKQINQQLCTLISTNPTHVQLKWFLKKCLPSDHLTH